MKSCRLWIGVVVLVAIPSVWVSPLWGGSHGMAKVSEPVVREIKELIPKKIPLDEIRPVPTEFLDQLEREGRLSPPWSDDVAASPYYLEENYTSMAVDATGRIWIGFSFDYPGGNAIAWGFKTSTDFGVSWDTRAWYISGVDYLYPSLAITDDGKYYFFGVLYSGTYNYYPCYCQSPAGQYNDPDAMDGVYYFSIPQRYYPEVKTYGNGNQFVIATYTRESGSSDTVFCLYSHDGMTNAFGLSFGLGTELQYTSIGVNVTGPDTILVHGFDEYVSDWNVYCLLDTLNGSGSLYGWYTTNTLNDVCPRVFFDQNYAYIAYTGEVGIFNSDIMFSYSTDNGANWSGIADITNDGTDETYCRLSGIAEKIGCVYIYGGNRLRFLYSYDNGQNWSAYEQVNDNGVNNVINEYSSASLLWTTGRLYASWTDNRDGDNDIYASYRDVGQGDITHRPDILLFDYTWVPAGPPPERIVSLNLPEKVDPRLKEHLAETSKDEYIPTVILLSTKLNHEWLLYKVRGMNRKDRRGFVVNELRRFQKESQGPLITFLNKEKAKGKVKRIVPDMSGFSVYAEVKPEVIEKLAMRPDVGELGLDEPLEFIGVTRGPDPYYKIPNWYPEREICWGVEKINAPDVWALGYTGDSIIVGHLDSGCDYNHPDLADHMWDGTPLGYPNHGWDFVDDDNNPMDEDGHGTNTGGIIAGDGTSGSYTGVAPDAQLMVQRVYPGGQPEMGAAIDSCLSWGADLISTSVGWSNPSDVLKDWNRNKCNSIYAAGLIYSTAAGNEGY
ncbi:MAG TPA: hypothetical protein EYP24_01060, partial [bacterium (Candidatus Stahlbacteria)]|nr:hypothetical protein [Candidatus Stahlbacteria bacterium]